MFADLHLHSIYSDGRYKPDKICRIAAERGLSLLSITDHDTLAGEENKRMAAKKYGLSYLTGWEISAYEQEQKLHILGYGCQLNDAYFDFMNARKKAAGLRAEDSVEKFRALGIDLSVADVRAERSAPDLPIHTMHVARAAAKKLGISETEVYVRYLAVGKPANSSIGRPTPKDAVDCIHACGGVAVIAHPGRIYLNAEEREKVILRLLQEGADGIECRYTTHTEEETAYFCRLAKEHGALITGGSDTHFEEETHKIGSPAFSPSEEFLVRVRLK